MSVGFLGVGAMGLPMAVNVLAELPVIIYDLDPERIATLADRGAIVAESAHQLAQSADVVSSWSPRRVSCTRPCSAKGRRCGPAARTALGHHELGRGGRCPCDRAPSVRHWRSARRRTGNGRRGSRRHWRADRVGRREPSSVGRRAAGAAADWRARLRTAARMSATGRRSSSSTSCSARCTWPRQQRRSASPPRSA